MNGHNIRRIALQHVVKRPDDPASIEWECDGASGSTQCEAWQVQGEIEGFERAGYTIRAITVNGVEVYREVKLTPVTFDEIAGSIIG